MKKILLLTTTIVLIIISCKETPPEEKTVLSIFTPFYRAPMVLNGKVKSFKVRTYWAKDVDGTIMKGDNITRLERDSLNFMSDFNLEFNENGITTRWEYISYDGRINFTEPEIIDNKIIGGKWFVNDDYTTYYKEEYDDTGKWIKEYIYRYGADTLMNRYDINHLEDGRIDEVFVYNNNDLLTRKNKFIWKNAEQVAEFQSYNGADDLIYSMKVEYDANDHFLSSVFDYPDVRLTKYDFKDLQLDEKGNVISGVSYKNDELFSITEYIIEYYQ